MRTQFTTRLPEPLASALATQAQANHRSANAELTAILRDALSGTPSTPAGHLSAAANRLRQYIGKASFSHGADRLAALCCVEQLDLRAQHDLTPYKAALQRLIDDSAALREKYEDLDAAVEQTRALL